MAYDFPASPSVGTIYSPASGPTWQWNGTTWLATAPSGLVPEAPTDGQNYVRRNGVWVLAPGTAEAKNRIVNPAFSIVQEGLPSITASGGYACDQWTSFHVSSAGVFTRLRAGLGNYTSKGGSYAFRVTITTPDAALAAGEYLSISQPLEGRRIMDFMWGYPTARQIVVRFGFRGPAGTYAMAITNATEARAYVAPFTISAGQANTEVEQIFVVPGDTTGTWPGDNNLGAYFYVVLAAGATFQGVAGWQTGPKYGTAAISNGMATGGAVFELTDVGLYLDPQNTGIAPPWQMPDEAQELAACQRYWHKVFTGFNGAVTSGTAYFAVTPTIVITRSTPALTLANTFNFSFPATASTLDILGSSVRDQRTANATAIGSFGGVVTVNARM